MNEIVSIAVKDFKDSEFTYTKFITPNDTGATGGHQSGFHISKNAWNLFFDNPGEKGQNKDVFITIKWQNDFETQSRVIYYGVGTRNEYRLTRFGKGFPYLGDDNIGDYLILCKKHKDYFAAYVLYTDEDIEDFMTSAGISVTDTNRVFKNQAEPSPDEVLNNLITEIVGRSGNDFPSSKFISDNARSIYAQICKLEILSKQSPDQILLGWVDTEYQLFKSIERKFYGAIVNSGFASMDALIDMANTILNRRKSRAGKALENHLASLFTNNDIRFETQVKTEGNKKPDFIFPDGKSYHDVSFHMEDLFFLGAKTTCKDRWRQILNEVNRIETKHLMTLQQGISKNQLEEMEDEKVVLVVPESYKSSFPKEYRDKILSLDAFIQTVKSRQNNNRFV